MGAATIEPGLRRLLQHHMANCAKNSKRRLRSPARERRLHRELDEIVMRRLVTVAELRETRFTPTATGLQGGESIAAAVRVGNEKIVADLKAQGVL
jgi:hypothetical protein